MAAKDATIKQVLLEREVERAAVKAGMRKPKLAGRRRSHTPTPAVP